MLKSIKLENSVNRIVLIAAAAVCLTATFFFAKWCLANAIATRAADTGMAELTVSMAGNDPQTHYALAVLSEKIFSAETLAKSLAEFAEATALAPEDFRLWLAYGKALERGGESAKAEIALRKSLALAPNYAAVQWTLGNVLIRDGKPAEGFAEIRRATENDSNYRLPTVAVAWQIFDGNLEEVKKSVGDSMSLNAVLAVFLAKQKRFDEAVEVWNRLPAADRLTVYKTDGEQIFAALILEKKYRQALQVQNDFTEKSGAETFAVGKIYNGGFEAELAREKANVFDWQIADGLQPQIGPNEEQKHGGSRSIFMIFNSTDGKDFRQISQIVAVEPARKYVFSGFYKANLKTAVTMRWEIADAATGTSLASANPIAAVNADWTNFSVPFAVAENVEAVVVRLVRDSCKSPICPISGSVWFDDFSISQ